VYRYVLQILCQFLCQKIFPFDEYFSTHHCLHLLFSRSLFVWLLITIYVVFGAAWYILNRRFTVIPNTFIALFGRQKLPAIKFHTMCRFTSRYIAAVTVRRCVTDNLIIIGTCRDWLSIQPIQNGVDKRIVTVCTI